MLQLSTVDNSTYRLLQNIFTIGIIRNNFALAVGTANKKETTKKWLPLFLFKTMKKHHIGYKDQSTKLLIWPCKEQKQVGVDLNNVCILAACFTIAICICCVVPKIKVIGTNLYVVCI